ELLDVLFQLLDMILLKANDGEQTLDQRSSFLDQDLGQLQLHNRQDTGLAAVQMRQFLRIIEKLRGRARHSWPWTETWRVKGNPVGRRRCIRPKSGSREEKDRTRCGRDSATKRGRGSP